jgi:predicted small secreted protein
MNIKLVVVLFALITLLPALSACNTMEGAGHDISNGGQDLENSAARNK